MKKWQELLITLSAIGVLYTVLALLLEFDVLSNYNRGIMILIGINIIAAASLNFATGILGQLALGHAGFMAIGAYTSAIFAKAVMDSGMPSVLIMILALCLGGTVAAAFGVAIGIPALRLRGDYLGIVTLGFGEIIRISIYNIKAIGGARPVLGIPKGLMGFTQIFFLVVIVLMALYLLIRSRHGRAILSIRENEIAAEAVGIPTTFYKIFGFATSAFFAGVAGGALAFNQRIIDPRKFTFMFSVEIFIIVVLGGMGSLTGTVIAAIVLGILNEWLHFIDQYRLVIYALLLVVMMIVRPSGLFGTREFSLVGLIKKLIARSKKTNSIE
ncbi:MAG: branched-chain amino acid ABC transporter permease [Firmicutes bacterium HGW-Firmicutes-1]|nr:MAG: branched-chain amino acid ABC transporter permease [Firmicutes bacterium HGW-Firmicutes-1]